MALRLGRAGAAHVVAFVALGAVFWALALWAAWAILRGPFGQITYDHGGYIGERAAIIRTGPPVEIAGYCASACTMHLANCCVHPGAVLIFHGPQVSDPAAFDHWSAVMARHYPPAIRDWFMVHGRFGEYRITGANAIAAGAQACGAVP